MRFRLAAVALVAWLGSVPARADGITDLDGWAKSFESAAGKTDTGAMTALIRQVAIKEFKFDIIEENDPKITKTYGGHRVLYTEQFDNKSLGDFRRRINVAVQYVDGQLFYAVEFMRLQDGWQLYGYESYPDVNRILKMEW